MSQPVSYIYINYVEDTAALPPPVSIAERLDWGKLYNRETDINYRRLIGDRLAKLFLHIERKAESDERDAKREAFKTLAASSDLDPDFVPRLLDIYYRLFCTIK